MKPREPRQKVLIKARVRRGASWGDVCILNISPRGLLLQMQAPPGRGEYIELRRGFHAIVARVVWAKHNRFGVRTQDPMPVDAIVNEPNRAAEANASTSNGKLPERRSQPRALQARYERSRSASRALEFAGVLLFVASAGVIAFQEVGKALSQPLSTITASLSESGDGQKAAAARTGGE